MKYIWPVTFALFVCICSSCEEEEIRFETVDSPIFALFEPIDIYEDSLSTIATFYQLKANNMTGGIDSLALDALELNVYIKGSTLLKTLQTNPNGQAYFISPVTELNEASQLEWVGRYANTPFRIYQRF